MLIKEVNEEQGVTLKREMPKGKEFVSVQARAMQQLSRAALSFI